MFEPTAPVDGLVRMAAERDPSGLAVRCGRSVVSFAELDERVGRYAAALRRLVGRDAVVGVAAVLSPAFAALFAAVPRSGNVVAIVNPMLRGPGLRHVAAAAGMAAAVVQDEQAAILLAARADLPRLRVVVVLSGTAPSGAVPLAALGDAGSLGPSDAASDTPACVQFTSGTTGPPKAVWLSHRSLAVNAAQTAAAHGLDGGCVTINHLPLYHLMHLNSALHAGATQVLCPSQEPAAAPRLASQVAATHLYSLPARLARLAAEPDTVPRLAGGRLRGIFSGGSALSPADARVLADRTGVPVVQGYGLAEMSPLTHCDDVADPVPGSVGRPVAGTACRIVDPRTRTDVAPGERGEILLRGPQLMLGYGGPGGDGIGPDGWFATGDLGRADPDGRLYLVDRIKDTFKCDNEIVSPSELERVLATHPAVADCVVVDRPDRFSGAVAVAGVVLRAGYTPADLEPIRAAVNDDLPYFQRIRHLAAVPAVPRSPAGKTDRRAARLALTRNNGGGPDGDPGEHADRDR